LAGLGVAGGGAWGAWGLSPTGLRGAARRSRRVRPLGVSAGGAGVKRKVPVIAGVLSLTVAGAGGMGPASQIEIFAKKVLFFLALT